MKPDSARLLEVFAVHLMTKVAPAMPHAYQQNDVSALGIMLLAVKEETERAASRRIEENAALRRLFETAAKGVRDATLRERLAEAANSADPGLTISELECANVALRDLLIDLHAHIEELDSPEARRLEQDIWHELAQSTERRRLSMGAF